MQQLVLIMTMTRPLSGLFFFLSRWYCTAVYCCSFVVSAVSPASWIESFHMPRGTRSGSDFPLYCCVPVTRYQVCSSSSPAQHTLSTYLAYGKLMFLSRTSRSHKLLFVVDLNYSGNWLPSPSPWSSPRVQQSSNPAMFTYFAPTPLPLHTVVVFVISFMPVPRHRLTCLCVQ